MNNKRLLTLILALLVIAISWWRVMTVQASLTVKQMVCDGVPLLYIVSKNAKNVPGVLIAHGYAGSKQLMLGYAYTLADAGYAVIVWDFDSHAANTKPLRKNSLQQNLDVAYEALVKQPEVDKLRLATLGHSMGSGAVMSAAINNVNRYAATVAISPTSASVTPKAPDNLQLQAGSWEGRFIANAKRLLESAGGENKNLFQGKGRELVIIPNAEHITILFRDQSHLAARNWLDATFGIQRQSTYVDYRMIWYVLHFLAWLVILGAIAPILTTSFLPSRVEQLKSWAGLIVAPFVASGTLVVGNWLGDIDNLGGVLVGTAVSIWFGAAGLTWLVIMSRMQRPTVRGLGIGIVLFIVLWIGFGAMAQVVWLQWWLTGIRLQLFPILALVSFPWFLASGIAQQNLLFGKRLLWWLGQSVALIGGFILVLYLLPNLGFIYLLLPLFPILMAIFSFTSSLFNEYWSYAIGNALFFGWMLAATFPLAS
ncbi:alpha/beta hydrolase [Nostoc sp. CHAB 5784]|uniref:alpha/beta hydrolase n=1 Tax=Nostoc mirabile TaxID=2907820 RepID=UPI001E5DFEB2|nr:alpha/beta fold hydrolase [Nostoc mirabile]MCC5669836.1 alpha/beta hydrolase [Nostoc mirabile CHAB5784]